jgi:hypothetical protein
VAWNRDRRADFDEARTLDRLEQLYSNTPDSPASSVQVIICAGDPSPDELTLLLHRFDGRFRVRFIWHEWADSAAWRQAKLLWLWGGPPPLSPLMRSLGQGLLVLAPAGALTDGIQHRSGAVIGYSTYLEALASITVVLEAPEALLSVGHRAPDLVRLIAAIAPRDSFHLPTGAPV